MPNVLISSIPSQTQQQMRMKTQNTALIQKKKLERIYGSSKQKNRTAV